MPLAPAGVVVARHLRWSRSTRAGRLVGAVAILGLLAALGARGSGLDDPSAGRGSERLSLVVIGDSIPYNSPDDCPPSAPLTTAQASIARTFIDRWDAMLCGSATAAGFTCADLHAAFNGADGTRRSGDLLGADHTHPSPKGNDLIASTLAGQGFAPLA